jgi:hypothetical protein
MAKTTIASLEARIIALELALASTPKPQAPAAPKLALKAEPVITYYTRGGQQYMKTRTGNRSVERLVSTPEAATTTSDEEYYGCPQFDDCPDRDLGWN